MDGDIPRSSNAQLPEDRPSSYVAPAKERPQCFPSALQASTFPQAV